MNSAAICDMFAIEFSLLGFRHTPYPKHAIVARISRRVAPGGVLGAVDISSPANWNGAEVDRRAYRRQAYGVALSYRRN